MSETCSTFKFNDKNYTCSFEITIDLIGGKWKPLIVWNLGTKGTQRFNELKRLVPQITHKMLIQDLRELEADDLVIRKVYPQVPPKVEYSLSQLGETLMPILSMMCNWGQDYYNLKRN